MKETIESLEKKIAFWSEKINQSNSPVDRAVLSDKISKARKEIIELKSSTKQVTKQQIDAPVVADRKPNTVTLERGQVMMCANDTFSMRI